MDADGRIEFAADYDPLESVRLQRLGSRDPTWSFEDGGFWRASNTPAGPVCVRVRSNGARIVGEAWGEGSEWALARISCICGAQDSPWQDTVEPAWLNALVQQQSRVRMGTALLPSDLLPALILQQRVRFAEAAKSWAQLVRRIGTPAPGPTELWVPPTGRALRSLRVAEYASIGVDAKRARTLRECGLHTSKLDRLADGTLEDARTWLPKLPGVGPWTSGLLLALGFGDADAVPTGDYHLPNTVAYAFSRRRRGTDEEMLKLLEPYRGHRFRVLRMLMFAGPRRPRGGPRLVPTPM